MRDKFVKNALDTSEIGNTGGSNTHSHTANSHTHTSTGTHTHTGSTGLDTSGGRNGLGIHQTCEYHTHTVSSVGTQTATYSTDNMSASTDDGQPPFQTVAYIQFAYAANGGGVAALM